MDTLDTYKQLVEDETSNEEVRETSRLILEQEVRDSLASHIHRCWGNSKTAKLEIETRMMDSLRAVKGEYPESKLSMLRKVGSVETYVPITAQKVRDAVAWIVDILDPHGDNPWSVEPTPEPTLPPDVEGKIKETVTKEIFKTAIQYVQSVGQPINPEEFDAVAAEYEEEVREETKKILIEKAKKAADKMTVKIADKLVEGGWGDVLSDIIWDIMIYPAGIMKGPVFRKRKVKKWEQNLGEWSPKTEERVVMEFDRVSPFDLYPSPDSTNIDDGYIIERHKLSRRDLNMLIGVPGYDDDNIRKVLNQYGTGGLSEWLWTDSDRSLLENQHTLGLVSTERIDALQFWGSVQGKYLLEWGMSEKDVPDEDLDYEIEAWLIGNYVIKAMINPDELGRKPYFKACFQETPGSFWGMSIPEIGSESQERANMAMRNMLNNMAIASGPQVEINLDAIDETRSSGTKLVPWKIWYTSDRMQSGTPSIRFTQPAMHTDAFMAIYERALFDAGDITGVPSYAHGNQNVGGAGDTASGLSMLMSGAARGIKQVLSNIDRDIIAPMIELIYDYILMTDPDPEIRGDIRVRAGGKISLIAKEQNVIRVNEVLRSSNNPVDLQIMGMDGRKELWKAALRSLDIPTEKILAQIRDKANPMEGVELEGGGNEATDATMGRDEKGTTLDAAGNPAQGMDTSLFEGVKGVR